MKNLKTAFLILALAASAAAQNFPTSLDTTTTLVGYDELLSAYLTSSLSAGATTANTSSLTSWPTTPFVIRIDAEYILATKATGSTLTLVRGINGTTADTHRALTTIQIVWSGYSWNPLRNAVLELQTKLGIGSSPAASASTNYILGRNGSGQTVWGTPATFGITGGVTAFTGLSDVPGSYSGQALKVVRVNAGATGLEFVTLAGGGDMLSTNNLSELTNIVAARSNLGVGSISTQDAGNLTGNFATGGLSIYDAVAGNSLVFTTGNTFTATRTFTLNPGDADRTLTMTGNATISGTNTGDQTITLTGDVTGTGTGSFATTIGAGTVSFSKMANMNTGRLLGRTTSGAGSPEEIRFQGGIENDGSGNLQIGAFTGDVTKTAGGSALTIANSAVTLAKMADVSTSTVFYRKTAGTGAPETQTLSTLKTDLGLTGTNTGDQTITLSGDVSGSGTGAITATIANGSVSYAKIQNVAANSILANNSGSSGNVAEVAIGASQLLGRGSTGNVAAITLGSGLTMSGTTLSASSSGGYAATLSAANAATTTDAQTLYWAGTFAVAPSTTAGNHRLYFPKAGTITSAYIWAHSATAGTNEAWPCSIRLNNTTDTLVQSLASNASYRVWSNTGLSIAVVAGDYIEVKCVNPTWATNPANVRFGALIYITE